MSKTKFTFREKLRYRFENTLSKGPIAIIGWLGIISALIVIIAATILMLTGINPTDQDLSYPEAVWQSLMRAMDAGAVAGDNGWPVRIIMFCVTVGGIFIIGSLIGTLTSALESSIDNMRKGRSRVIESNHTLILGWSPKIFTIISELLIANANQKNARIVILADREKVDMEDDIFSKFPDTKNTKIICRSGSPLDLNDLEVVNPNEARSVIIISPEETNNPDTFVIKSILALTNNPNRRKDRFHIVAELRDEENLEAAELVGNNGEACLVLSADLIARVTAQTCRQSGLSVVYTELLDFDGAEIYFKKEPSLIGKTYKYIANSYEDSAIIGMMRKDESVLLNPPMDTILEEGDTLIAIAEDDDTIVLSQRTPPSPDKDAIKHDLVSPIGKERTLMLGWNEKGAAIVRELDNYVELGSEVLVICNDERVAPVIASLSLDLKKQSIRFVKGKTTERAVIDSHKVTEFDHVILLCAPDMDIQEADAEVLISLLHLRNIADTSGKDFAIVSEMRDIRNRALADVAKADDFIVSDKLVSLMMSQLSENKHLEKVFQFLFSANGAEIYLKPVSDYVRTGRQMNFYTLLEAAAERGETAIGYRIASQKEQADKAYGVVVNPKKSTTVTFGDEDKIIVLATA
ncbi:MAG: CASTOR/POLLUX-related putative ion channel [Bacteroidia bacterium]